MTTNLGPLTKGRKIILLGIAAGLCLMLLSSVMYRSMHPSIVKESRRRPPQTGQQVSPMEGAGNGIGTLMQQMQKDPNNIEILTKLADTFIHQEDWARAENFLMKAITIAPTDTQTLYLLGITQFNQKKAALAAETFETLLAIAEDAHARFNLGVIYKHYLNKPDMADKHLKAILSIPGVEKSLQERAQKELAATAHNQ